MSRSGYNEDWDFDQWAMIRWRGVVASSIRGRRGQALLREMIDALDAMREKRLTTHDLSSPAGVCALGCVGVARGMELDKLDPEDPETIAAAFGVATPLVQEIEWENDEAAYHETPEGRWARMRRWAVKNLKSSAEPPSPNNGMAP